jgi:uncharacterized protein
MSRQEMKMVRSPIDVVKMFLKDPTNPAIVCDLVADDATYVSLNFENRDLKMIMPWAGTAKGPQAFIDAFTRVFRFWESQNFGITELFGTGKNVAVFGKFTYKSNTLGKVATSPFSILAKVKEGKIVYFQFMEDTFATASTFKISGSWTVRSDPEIPKNIEV